ncbi:hypothetical protein CPB86DRAFT_710240, partial [Serendipita vermifera]
PSRRRRMYKGMYVCTWNGCVKSYDTLSHLNDHVALQGHGPKRRTSGMYSFIYILSFPFELYADIMPEFPVSGW